MSPRIASRRWVVAGIGALVLAGAGGAGAWAVSRGNEPAAMQYAPSLGPLPKAPNNSEAIAETLQGLDKSVFRELRLGPPPSEKYPHGLWMYATVNGEDHGQGDYLPAMWEADLAQGAIADRLADGQSNLAEVIVGSTLSLNTGDASSLEDLGGGTGDVAAGQVFGAQAANESDNQIISEIKVALAADGLMPQEVRILHPLGPAVYIRASVDDMTNIKDNFDTLLSSIQGNGRYEGVYLEVDRPDDSPVLRSANAYRAGSGAVWFAPGIDQNLDINHGGHPTVD